jgi:hypothetical protein
MSKTVWPIMRRVVIFVGLLMGLLLVTLYALKDKIMLGAEAYVYGYPLVIMDITRKQSAINIGPEKRAASGPSISRCQLQRCRQTQCRHPLHHCLSEHEKRAMAL